MESAGDSGLSRAKGHGMLEIPKEENYVPEKLDLTLRPLDKPSHLGVVMPTWLGDACMATPTLRAIRQRYPQTKITMICRPIVRELLWDAWGDAAAWADDCLMVAKRGGDGVHTRASLTKAVRGAAMDSAVLLTNSFWSAAVMRLAGVRRIVGYQRDARGWLLSDRVPVPRVARKLRPISAVDYYLELARWIGCAIDNRMMQLDVADGHAARAAQLFEAAGLDPREPTLVINSNAATAPDRLWPAERVCELSRRVAEQGRFQVLLHCGPQERERTNQMAAEVNHPRVASMGVWESLPITLSKAVLKQATAVVSSDSGPRHIAIALNRQAITLFGPTSPEWTRTYNRPEILLQNSVQGSPSMSHISVDEVWQALQTIQPSPLQTPPARTEPLAA